MKKYLGICLLLVTTMCVYGMEQERAKNINDLIEGALTKEAIRKVQLRRMSPPQYREDLSQVSRSKKFNFDDAPRNDINASVQKEQEKK